MHVDFTKSRPCFCCMRQIIRVVSSLVKTDIFKFFVGKSGPIFPGCIFTDCKTVPYDEFRMDGTVDSPLALIVSVVAPISQVPTRASR